MADDRELLDRLGKALSPGRVEPPRPRVDAVRRLVVGHRRVLRAVPGAYSKDLPDQAPVSKRGPADRRQDLPDQAPDSKRGLADRRLTMVFSGVAAAALLVIAAVSALQAGSSSAPSSTLLRAQNAAYRVQVAIERKDPAQVAKADADLLRSAETVAPEDRSEVQRIAVPAHVQAIAFLRDHASSQVLSDVSGAVPSNGGSPLAGSPDAAGSPLAPLPTSIVPKGVPTSVGPAAVPPIVNSPTTTVGSAPVEPTVKITSVVPRLNGNFEVNFSVSGFTPDASGAPGTYTLRFSYDGGADPTTYTGESPWSVPLLKAILHRQVCAEVVDAAGAVVPDSGTCTNIINL